MFLDLVDEVFVLEVDTDTLHQRLDVRPADEFGNGPEERALVLRLHQTREDLPSRGVSIDATLEPHAYGTEIRMYVHGVASGTLCRVSLRGPGGATYPAGTFRYRWGEDSEAVLSSALDLSRTRAVVVQAGKRTFVAPLGSAPATAGAQLEEEPT